MANGRIHDALFIEVRRVSISSNCPRRKMALLQAAIRHDSEEALKLVVEGHAANSTQRMFIRLGQSDTSLLLRQTRLLRASKLVDDVPLRLSADNQGEIKCTAGREFLVQMTFGEVISKYEVAMKRKEDAETVLESDAKTKYRIRSAAGQLKMMLSLGVCVSSIYVDTARFILQKVGVEGLSESYLELKNAALDCIGQMNFNEGTNGVLKTDQARERIESAMGLVIRALHLFSTSSSKRFFGRYVKPSPRDRRLSELIDGLREEREQLQKLAFELHAEKERQIQRVDAEESKLMQLIRTNASSFCGRQRCSDVTRVDVLHRLASWARDESCDTKPIFWLYGTAGCGKTTIAASIAEQLSREKRLVGSFFCERNEKDLSNPSQIINTLAFHLSDVDSGYRSALLKALDDPVLGTDIDVVGRFNMLLEKPLRQLRQEKLASSTAHSTFVVDALDECADAQVLSQLLVYVAKLVPWLRIITTSRDFSPIAEIFNASSALVERSDLYVEYNATEDMRCFLLRKIESEDLGILLPHVDELVTIADGLFIWLYSVVESIKIEEAGTGRERLVQDVLRNRVPTVMEKILWTTYSTVLSLVEPDTRRAVSMHALLTTAGSGPSKICDLYERVSQNSGQHLTFNEFAGSILLLKPILKLTVSRDGSLTSSAAIGRNNLEQIFVQIYHPSVSDFFRKELLSSESAYGMSLRIVTAIDDIHESDESRVLERLQPFNLDGCILGMERDARGVGSYGDVFRGICRIRHRGEVPTALKRFRMHLGSGMNKLFLREVYVWSKLNHPNVLPLLGYAFDNKDTGYPFLISEWMEKGNALNFVRSSNPSPEGLFHVILDVLNGLAYLHRSNVVHSDLKPENILIGSAGQAMIGDFGCARIEQASRTLGLPTASTKGTYNYWAPEFLSFTETEGSSTMSKEGDVWAFGMTIYALVTQKAPYAGLSDFAIWAAISRGSLPTFPNEMSKSSNHHMNELLDVCKQCWERDAKRRPTIDDILTTLVL